MTSIMIKIYSSQNIPNAILTINNVTTNETEWWMIYDANTLKIIIPPQQCSGGTSSPYTMIISDTLEELEQYIEENDLILPESS